MKIMLIQPPKSPVTIGGEDVFLYEPLALEYISAGVTQDHDVRILDMRLEKDLSDGSRRPPRHGGAERFSLALPLTHA